jgi:hypothetical protein
VGIIESGFMPDDAAKHEFSSALARRFADIMSAEFLNRFAGS